MNLGTVVTRGPDVAEPDQSAAGAPNGLGDWPDPSPRRAEPFQAVDGAPDGRGDRREPSPRPAMAGGRTDTDREGALVARRCDL